MHFNFKFIYDIDQIERNRIWYNPRASFLIFYIKKTENLSEGTLIRNLFKI